MLYCVGRDIEYRELRLEFDNNTHLWSLVSDSITNEPQPSDEIILHLSAVMKSLLSFTGTATELAAELEKHSGEKLLPNVLMKRLYDAVRACGNRNQFYRIPNPRPPRDQPDLFR